jgi:signal transduction histidine kinase
MQVLDGGPLLKAVRVLVADDDAVFRALVRSNLEARVDDLREADDGQQAWDLLLGETFELALIDLSMPGIDGFALIRCIRSHPRTRHLPIVVITSSTDPVSVEKALEAGATSFLTKPVNWSLFGHQIDYLIRLERSSAAERATKHRAEAVARAKDALIAVLAARVRAQTRRLISTSEMELWRRPAEEGSGLGFAACVLSDARAIEDILDEVLPFVRSMTEQIVVDDCLVPVRRLLEACADRFRAMAEKGDVTIEVAPFSPTLRVRCDEIALSRALGNLVRNAVEFTRPGSCVRLNAELREDFVLSLMVDDEGPGVEPEAIARCLKPLDQREAQEPRVPEEAALGLPVAKAIAEAHGGTIEIAPRSPLGSRASLILPPEIVEARLDDVA